MNRLSNIPIWAWYLFSVAYCYLLWNPYYSLWHFAQSGSDPALKAVAIVLSLIIGSLYLVEGHRSLNAFGIVLFMALTAAIMWLAFNHGTRFSHVDMWGQWIVGALLTLALQGGRIYRSLTGRVPVASDGSEHGHHNT